MSGNECARHYRKGGCNFAFLRQAMDTHSKKKKKSSSNAVLTERKTEAI